MLLGPRTLSCGLGTTCQSHHRAVCHPSPLLGSQPSLTPSLPIFPEEADGLECKAAAQKELSDMDYLRSKVVAAESSEEEESEDEAVNFEEGSEAEEEGSCTAPTQQDREAAPAEVKHWSLGREEVHPASPTFPAATLLGV